MTKRKNLDTLFNTYRRIGNPYKEKLDQGKRLLAQLEDFGPVSPENWDDYKALEGKYLQVREECNDLAAKLRQVQEDLAA